MQTSETCYLQRPLQLLDKKFTVDIFRTILKPKAEEEMPLKLEFMKDNEFKPSCNLVKNWSYNARFSMMKWPSLGGL